MFDLSGKTALITGAGQGVGAGIANALAQQGANIAVNDYFPERAEAAAAAIHRTGARALAVPFDVTDKAGVEEAMGLIAGQLGPVDILVSNVGTLPHGMMPTRFVDTDADEWQQHIDNNLYGTLNCCKAVARGMSERRWGRIIATSSDAARVGHFGSAVYGAAKASLEGLMRTLAKELGPKGVTANAIVLGLINTVPEDYSQGAEKYYATRRIGTPEDVGAAAVYLASEEAGWVTGHSLVVNGGFLGA